MAQVQKQEKLDLSIVQNKFEASLIEEDDVDVRIYLEGCRELSKFLTLLGIGFSFISKDLNKYIENLDYFFYECHIIHLYITVKTMTAHETRYELVDTKQYVSGVRNLLTIHRKLEFIHLFLKGIGESPKQETTADICRKAYDQTLSKDHSFIARNVTKIGIYFLPSREELLKQIFGDEEHVQQNISLLPKALETYEAVYARIKTIYTGHDLYNLQPLC